jgi:hypothetical protein
VSCRFVVAVNTVSSISSSTFRYADNILKNDGLLALRVIFLRLLFVGAFDNVTLVRHFDVKSQ